MQMEITQQTQQIGSKMEDIGIPKKKQPNHASQTVCTVQTMFLVIYAQPNIILRMTDNVIHAFQIA
jgi:hypothetical protein